MLQAQANLFIAFAALRNSHWVDLHYKIIFQYLDTQVKLSSSRS